MKQRHFITIGEPKKIKVSSLIKAIHAFNKAGLNKYKEIQPLQQPGAHPLLVHIQVGAGKDDIEFPFKGKLAMELGWTKEDFFHSRHKYLFVSTKAYIKQVWHRTYKYNTETQEVEEVRLLVNKWQEPNYFINNKSAMEWTKGIEECKVPQIEDPSEIGMDYRESL